MRHPSEAGDLDSDCLTSKMTSTYVPTVCRIPTESSVSQGHPYAPPYVCEERGPESQSLEMVGLPGSQDTSQDPNVAALIGV